MSLSTYTTIRRLISSVGMSLAAGAASAQSPDMTVAIDAGGAPQAIARFADGRWVKATDVLQCAPRGAAERIVVAGGDAEAARPITAATNEWKAIEPVIVRVFELRQREHGIAAANLSGVPIQIDWVYGQPARDGQAAIYYFEASRRVPDPGTAPEEDPKGTLRVAVSGWLHHNGSGVTALGAKSELGWEQDRSDDSPPRGPDLVPLGVVAHDSRWIWVMKGRAGDIGWVTAYLVGESGVRILADAVRCAR